MEPIEASLKVTYRALLARGLDPGEAANLTAFLHGLPSDGVQWTMPEVEGILRRRLAHAADLRASEGRDSIPSATRSARSTIHDRRQRRTGSTHVIDPPET
jgi:hypothetical protein